MARALTTLLATETVKTVTAPFFLIEIGFSSTLRLSTRGSVLYGGYTWTGGTASMVDLHGLAGGALEGEISIGNTDSAIAAIVLGQSLRDVPVTIWLLYGAEPYAAGAALQVFTGVLDGATLTPTRVSLRIVSAGRRSLYGPRLYCQFPMMPPPNTTITWGGQKYILKASSNNRTGFISSVVDAIRIVQGRRSRR
jgi:hypothetical protein